MLSLVSSHINPADMLCLISPNNVVPATGLGKREKKSLCLTKGPEMLLGFFGVGFVPAWEPDLAGGGLPRASPHAPSANGTHAAWPGLMKGQHGWEEILNLAVGHSGWWHPWHGHSNTPSSWPLLASVARVPCRGVPVFLGSLVSLGTERAQPGLKCLSSCHSMPQTVSVYSAHAACLASIG